MPVFLPTPCASHAKTELEFEQLFIIICYNTIIIIIAFKGAVQDFLRSPHCAANCLQHVHFSGQGTIVWKSRATHRAPITCNMLCTIWYEGTAQLLSLTELKSHLFWLYLIGWTIKTMKEGRKLEYPEKNPGDKLQKMPHTKAWRLKPQARLEPTQ